MRVPVYGIMLWDRLNATIGHVRVPVCRVAEGYNWSCEGVGISRGPVAYLYMSRPVYLY